MSKLDPKKVSSYNYELPSQLIAEKPSLPKSEGKLLVYKRATKEIIHTTFGNIFEYIPQDTTVVLNNTKVIKARIFGKKQSGGKIELLLNSPTADKHFLVYIKGKVKVGTHLEFDKGLEAEVLELFEDGMRKVAFYHDKKQLDFDILESFLEQIGHIPLPPYIKREDQAKDEVDYQSLFAKHKGAVAAPTASLHFDNTSFATLKHKHNPHYLTLHIGAGTFKSVEATEIDKHKMHSELYAIPKTTQTLINSDKKILAVGTTVTRTVEYYIRNKQAKGSCDLFLHPENKPQRVNYLLTNFHLPCSTLIMLVASFTSLEETLSIYQQAIEKKYKFYSYGDSMLIV